jgi:3-oxoacyl-[acyl-carrier protein] reductase
MVERVFQRSDTCLEGKIALVTGGSEGIGKVSARTLAAEGARVMICARRPDVLEGAAQEIRQETGGDVVAVRADVTVPEQIERMFDTLIATYGELDILLNNAGKHMSGHIMDMTDEQWHADLDLKLMAPSGALGWRSHS